MRRSTLTNARAVVGVAAAIYLLIACGGSSQEHRPSNQGAGGASGVAGGQSGAPADAGETGSDRGGEAGAQLGAAGEGASGAGGVAGSALVGGASTGAVAGTSGASGAGGASGAAGVSGAAGTAGMAPLPLPDGCEARGQSEDETSCSLGVFCGSVPNIANCTRLESGSWQCSCELRNNDRVYEIEGQPGLPSCAIAAGLCFEEELDLDEEVCSELGAANAEACDLDLSCGKRIRVPFAPDVTVSLMDYGRSACARTGSTLPFECFCDYGGVSYEYGVLAEDGTLACRPLVDFCRSRVEPSFEEPTVCFERESSGQGVEACDLHWICATPLRLTDDVSLAQLEPRDSSCDASASGSRCYCSNRTESFGFDLDVPPAPETCESAIINCADDVSIVPVGEAACQTTSQTAGTDFCEADLDCRQAATVDEREITARGRLLVYCRQAAADQPWWCACASNQDSTIFEFGAPETLGWDVCEAAPAGCLEHMPVFIGPYGEYMSPPDPLSGEIRDARASATVTRAALLRRAQSK